LGFSRQPHGAEKPHPGHLAPLDVSGASNKICEFLPDQTLIFFFGGNSCGWETKVLSDYMAMTYGINSPPGLFGMVDAS
jgi:hypothetical protein